ncbi:hypothetical protein [Halomonas sp. MES3-P3E]|uniref:hypothetical protein n=2 Tax=Halomonadaceae TaxID=28256 RepID=UPI0012FEB034|nr:hypothetical protein [Halomonas sp. MES3-P3E]
MGNLTSTMKIFKKDSAHFGIHPEIAFRLSQVLAHLHPTAIPSESRTPPKRKPKEFVLMDRLLQSAIINLLGYLPAAPTPSFISKYGH